MTHVRVPPSRDTQDYTRPPTAAEVEAWLLRLIADPSEENRSEASRWASPWAVHDVAEIPDQTIEDALDDLLAADLGGPPGDERSNKYVSGPEDFQWTLERVRGTPPTASRIREVALGVVEGRTNPEWTRAWATTCLERMRPRDPRLVEALQQIVAAIQPGPPPRLDAAVDNEALVRIAAWLAGIA